MGFDVRGEDGPDGASGQDGIPPDLGSGSNGQDGQTGGRGADADGVGRSTSEAGGPDDDDTSVYVQLAGNGGNGGWGGSGSDGDWEGTTVYGGDGGDGGNGGNGGASIITIDSSPGENASVKAAGGDGGAGGPGGQPGSDHLNDGLGGYYSEPANSGSGGNGGLGGGALVNLSGIAVHSHQLEIIASGGHGGNGGGGSWPDLPAERQGLGGDGSAATLAEVDITASQFSFLSSLTIDAQGGSGGAGGDGDLHSKGGVGGDASINVSSNDFVGTDSADTLYIALAVESGSGGRTGYSSRFPDDGDSFVSDGHTSINFSDNTFEGGAGDDTLTIDIWDNYERSSIFSVDFTIDEFWIDGQLNFVHGIEHIIFNNIEYDAPIIVVGTPGADNFEGGNGDDVINGDGGSDTIDGNEGNDVLSGGSGNDFLYGDDGNDILDGGTGKDSMVGGDGNDTFYVDNVGDTVDEREDSGNDTVITSINYILPDNVENLTLSAGGGKINGVGNARDNVITGNSSANTLSGLAGNDTLDGRAGADAMLGGAGNDTYYVDNAGDVVTELHGGGADTVISSRAYTLGGEVEKLTLTGTGNLAGTGNSLNNTIIGNDGNNKVSGLAGSDSLSGGLGDDTLDGGKGADVMKGGLGNDRYYMDNKLDSITEYANQGTDTVLINGTYALGLNVENLTLTGAGDRFGSGNALNNTITGNRGNNTLGGADGNDVIDGGKGADSMRGGNGDDIFYVDNTGDAVTEYSGQGNDSVFSSISFTLGNNVENLTLTGVRALDGTGNIRDNVLTGNGGNNILDGGRGHDTLTGGLGADSFVFSLASGADMISDFSAADNDKIDVSAYHGQATAVVVQVGLNTTIDLGGGNIITILNSTATDAAFLGHIVW